MDRILYLAVLAVVSVIRALPITVCFGLGKCVGAVMWAILPKYRRLAEENMASVFEHEKSPAGIRTLAFQHFTTVGANFCCALKMAAMSQEAVDKCISVENFEVVREALGRGKGVVCAYSHLGNWEAFAQRHDTIHPFKAATIYQAIRNKQIDDLINQGRRRRGVETFNRKKDLGRALSMLRKGNMIVILTDQHAGDAGIWMPFFDRLASTSPLAASLAVKTGAAVIPIGIFTSGFAKWRLVAGKEIPYDPAQPEQLTADINRALEAEIRESPADWFWVHNRWKMPSPRFLLSDTKRGVFLPAGYDPATLRRFRILICTSDEPDNALLEFEAVRAIKRGRPDVRVTILTHARLGDLWHSVAEVDDVIAVSEDRGVFSIARRIRGHFDVAVLLSNSPRRRMETWLAGIRRRVGHGGGKYDWMLDQIVREPKRKSSPRDHAASSLRLAGKIGAPLVAQDSAQIPMADAQPEAGPSI